MQLQLPSVYIPNNSQLNVSFDITYLLQFKYCHHHQGNGGDSKHLWNVGQILPDSGRIISGDKIFLPAAVRTFNFKTAEYC
jgi:hypothetical protein